MEQNILIRPALGTDYPAMAGMLQTLATRFIVPGMPAEAAATFLRDNDEAALREYRARGQVASVAQIGAELAGFIAVRPPSHVFHLFVAERWQRRGVARALWRTACAQADPAAVFTVNSSPYGLPVYAALGFRCDGALQCRNGVRFQPMIACRSAQSALHAPTGTRR